MSTLGSMFIETDKTIYIPGDTIKGKINLCVLQENYQGNTLILNILGHEQSYWLEQEQSGYQKRNTREQVIYKDEVVIHIFNSMVLPVGQFSFPFEFQLNTNIPESIELKESNYSCEIQYKFIAEIKTSQKCSMVFKHSQNFIVKQINQGESIMLKEQDQPNIYEWKFFNRGSTFFEATIQQNQFIVGDDCDVDVIVNNSECSKDIQSIYLQLINQITLHFENDKKQVFERIIQQSRNPGPKAKVGQTFIKFKLPIKSQRPDKKLFGTVESTLVESSYIIKVILEIQVNCFKIMNPFIQLPIRISTQTPPPPPPPLDIPKDWKPMQFDTQIVQINQHEKSVIRRQTTGKLTGQLAITQPSIIKSKTTQVLPEPPDPEADLLRSLPPKKVPTNHGQLNIE